MHRSRAVSHLHPGAVVRIRGERWRVVHVAPHETCSIVDVAGAGHDNSGETSRFILPFEDAQPIPSAAGPPRVVRPATLRRTARAAIAGVTPAWTSLRAAAGARITLLPYQLEPAIAAARGLACRFLLADEVGLGKTIQAGLLVAELLARERDARALIVTPASLREQWRDELHDRFSIEAEILDAAGLARAAARLPSGVNPWSVPRVVLTSIDFIKRPDVIRALEPLVWDLVAFDEAHALSGRSDRATAAELLASRARRLVAITATPHTGDPRAFEKLCALGRLDDNEPMIIWRRSRTDAGLPGGRRVRLIRVRPSSAEQALHRALDAYARHVWRDAPSTTAPAARLAMIVLARRASSSPSSLARSLERRVALLTHERVESDSQLRLPLDEGMTRDDEAPDAELAAPGLSDAAAERRMLDRLLRLARSASDAESKIAALVRFLRRASEPAIVFTEYRDTLERLRALLPPGAAQLHGGLTSGERLREVRRFTHGEARLLLATDAASEGLNLHYRCRLVINLEVPWTPLRLEQRTGRVDRLGQTHRVHAIGLIGRGTAEESVASALLARGAIAAREAPFGALGSTPPKSLMVVNLRAEAEAEAARLRVWRALGGSVAAGDERPLVAIVKRTPHRLIFGLRVTFTDDTDAIVWDTLIGAALDFARGPGASARDVRTWFEGLASRYAAGLEAAGATAHRRLLHSLERDIRAAAAALVARESAILGAIKNRGGRLAVPLVQPGLFDRRALRHADAQRYLAEEATRAAAERIAALRRAIDPRAGERRLVFAVVA